MNEDQRSDHDRLHEAYAADRPRLLSRLRAAGRSLQEAEDVVHDVFAEAWSRLPFAGIRNLSAWLNSLVTRRAIDAWRRDQRSPLHPDVAEDTWRELIADTGLDPLDGYVRENLVDALYDALEELPREQREVVEAQVFEGLTFREIAERTGEGIDTLTARKRYAVQRLAKALREWIED